MHKAKNDSFDKKISELAASICRDDSHSEYRNAVNFLIEHKNMSDAEHLDFYQCTSLKSSLSSLRIHYADMLKCVSLSLEKLESVYNKKQDTEIPKK